jgi:RNA polymerase sigma-70 factor (ECF subfamily)
MSTYASSASRRSPARDRPHVEPRTVLDPISRRAVTQVSDAAWRALYEEHFDALFRVVSRLGVEGTDREDIVQRAFELAFVKVSAGLPLAEVGPWLRGTTGHLVRAHRRWRRVRRFHASVVEAIFAEREGPATPQNEMSRSETRTQIEKTMGRMSPKLRDVLVLLEVEDLSVEEVGQILGIPVNTVRSRLRLAREQFRGLWGTSDERVGVIA